MQAIYRIPQYIPRSERKDLHMQGDWRGTYDDAHKIADIAEGEDAFNTLRACIALERTLNALGGGSFERPVDYIFLARSERMVAADIGL